MPDLATFQQVFLTDIYQGGNASAGWLKPTQGGISPAQSLKVYYHSTRGILIDALLSTFPVVTRLVGDPFMKAMVTEFMREYPCGTGDLNAYGAALSHFIQTFSPASDLPYLADVARLEWAMHHATFAPDAPKLNLERLTELSEEDSARIKLIPHPSLSLVHSLYPLEHIWLANQPDTPTDNAIIQLDEGGSQLAIWRPEMDVLRWAVPPVPFTLLQHLASGASLALALHATLQHHTDTSLESLHTDIATLLAHNLFTDIHLNPKGDH